MKNYEMEENKGRLCQTLKNYKAEKWWLKKRMRHNMIYSGKVKNIKHTACSIRHADKRTLRHVIVMVQAEVLPAESRIKSKLKA